MFDAFGIAAVLETGGHPIEQSEPPIDFAEQHGAAVGGDPAAVEAGGDLALEMFAEIEFLWALVGVTLWGHGLFPPAGSNALLLQRLCHRKRPVS